MNHNEPLTSLRAEVIFLTLAILCIWIALAVASVQVSSESTLAAIALRPTPTPTATATSGWWDGLSLATPELPALPGLPELSLERGGGQQGQGPVSFTPISCPGPQARIAAITADGVWWHIQGTASLPDNFWYWKAELSTGGAFWTHLYRSESQVAGGKLMDFHTGTVPPGRYHLRLTVVDRTGNYPEPCTVEVALP